jgi:hypothetical protein
MHDSPLAAAPSRSLEPRPKPIPAGVRAACLMMIYEPTDFIAAAKANGLKPETLRRWLHRPEVIGLLRKERAAFRAAICAGNERVLADIRDTSENAMARVHSIKALEGLDAEAVARQPGQVTPGITIRVVHQQAAPPPSGPVIDVTPPVPAVVIPVPRAIAQPVPRHDAAGHRVDDRGRPVDERGNPIFQAPKPWD